VVHLTSAENVALDVLRRNKLLGMGLREVALELGLADHLVEVGTGLGVAQQALREEEDELREGADLVWKRLRTREGLRVYGSRGEFDDGGRGTGRRASVMQL
jgi:hypothetical protein